MMKSEMYYLNKIEKYEELDAAIEEYIDFIIAIAIRRD